MVYLDSLREELAEALEERERLDARIEQLEDAIAALARLDGDPDDPPLRRGSPDDEPPLRSTLSDEPPRRGWAGQEAPRRMEPRTDLRDLLDRHQEDIADQIGSLEASLPFVGLKYYRDQLLPQVVGEMRQGELRSLMDLMVDSGLVDVYQVENPNNPDFPTAAIRLPLTDDADEPNDADGVDEPDDPDENDEPDDSAEPGEVEDAEALDDEPL